MKLSLFLLMLAAIGIVIVLLGHAGQRAKVAPSVQPNEISWIGYLIAAFFGILAWAIWAGTP